jgi:hypothetical protein
MSTRCWRQTASCRPETSRLTCPDINRLPLQRADDVRDRLLERLAQTRPDEWSGRVVGEQPGESDAAYVDRSVVAQPLDQLSDLRSGGEHRTVIECHAARGVGVAFHGGVEDVHEPGRDSVPLGARRELPSPQLAQWVARRGGAGRDLTIEVPLAQTGAHTQAEVDAGPR